MKRFFETSGQASIFLAMVPLGLLLALCIDVSSVWKKSKAFWDIVAVLLCGLALAMMVVLFQDEQLRIYHLLALLVGVILYTCGFHRVWQWGKRGIKRLSDTKKNNLERQEKKKTRRN
ncbi:MAG: hypothetical protein E7319_02640 [Clostridiales bacterium]|nr:hypothetical protein [Clostridiales bacterium]